MNPSGLYELTNQEWGVEKHFMYMDNKGGSALDSVQTWEMVRKLYVLQWGIKMERTTTPTSYDVG